MKTISIIGAGPAGLMAAEKLAERGLSVSVYDHRPSPARKFLMAGRGGLNITHSEPLEDFMARYGDAASFLRPALENFTPQNLRDWCSELGEETFIGSSGRVFPKSFKASPLLRAWLKRLDSLGVKFHYNYEWTGQDMGTDMTILAMGGASWPRLGSDAAWTKILTEQGIQINPFRPTNCGFTTNWSNVFKEKYAGTPIKPVIITHENQSVQGEIMVTQNGVEGGGIYALSRFIRDSIDKKNQTTINLDLKPDTSIDKLTKLLNKPRGRDSFSNHLRKTLSLSPVVIGLLQEDRNIQSLSHQNLATHIKSYPLVLNSIAPIDRAISSAGGIARDELTDNFMLKKIPNTYAIGEMIDWEAPTGGYLLQASFSMAVYLARNL